jgi:hypothetical protein
LQSSTKISDHRERSPSGVYPQKASQIYSQALDQPTLDIRGVRLLKETENSDLRWSQFYDQIQKFKHMLEIDKSIFTSKVIYSDWPTICSYEYNLDCHNVLVAMYSRIQKSLLAARFDERVNDR